jgi:hypothetical protein
MVKIPGIDIDFGGTTYTVPPIALGDLQLLQDRLKAMGTADALAPDSVAAIVDATHAALKRNYPDLTREQVGSMVDVSNMFEVITTVMDVTGMKRKQAEELKNQLAQQPAA